MMCYGWEGHLIFHTININLLDLLKLYIDIF